MHVTISLYFQALSYFHCRPLFEKTKTAVLVAEAEGLSTQIYQYLSLYKWKWKSFCVGILLVFQIEPCSWLRLFISSSYLLHQRAPQQSPALS